MAYHFIDVSDYQGRPDWKKVKATGVDGVIMRILNSAGTDAGFEYNYGGCVANGLAKGVYRYSYALTTAQAKEEAEEVLQVLTGRKLETGVFLDLEYNAQRKLGSAKVKQIAGKWMEVIRAGGYECNIYCNLDWYKNVCGGLNAKYWIARYPRQDTGKVQSSLRPNVGEIGWQYSSKGRVPGITGNVDMNLWYGDLYPVSADTIFGGLEYSPVFDASYYAGRYKDLKAVYGNDAAALFYHFIAHGMSEGRQAIDTFNVQIYRARYPDLQKAFGENLPLYYQHYIRFGIAEKRRGL